MSNKKLSHIDKILESIDSLLIENKEQKLKTKLAEKIRESIFTDEIVTKMNECDFSEILEEDQSVVKLFDSIFPISLKVAAGFLILNSATSCNCSGIFSNCHICF